MEVEEKYREEERFDLETVINRQDETPCRGKMSGEEEFLTACSVVRAVFDREWDIIADDHSRNLRLEREKRAIIGYELEVGYYKERIRDILRDNNMLRFHHPPWYPDLTEGVFAELYGLAGLAPWAYDMNEKYRRSSSAKLIGERMYCLIDGRSELQPQRITDQRREQLKRTLLLATPEERLEAGFHEVYLHNGIRITIYSGSRTKEGEDIMVFRKYILRELTFEEMIRMRTIPAGAAELFRCMVGIGFNVLFSGQVRSGKTTFLQTWQKYEDPTMEGLAIATDPETPWHRIMPDAPIMQIIADGKDLSLLSRSLLRGDNDYILLEEMRDAPAFRLALDITSTGTMRSKATIHDNNAVNIPYKMASRIHEEFGGDLNAVIAQVYRNFDYCLEFCQHPEDRRQKIMTGITEFDYDAEKDQVTATRICRYDFRTGTWRWNCHISKNIMDKVPLASELLQRMQAILRVLEKENPLIGDLTVHPAYYRRRI